MSTQHDSNGVPYNTGGTGPAQSGQHLTINTPNGPVQGTMVGTVVVPNKTN